MPNQTYYERLRELQGARASFHKEIERRNRSFNTSWNFIFVFLAAFLMFKFLVIMAMY